MMPNRFYRIVSVVAALALLLDLLAFVDFFLHPLAGDHDFKSALYRGITVLVLIPFTLFVSFLIIKRVPGNVVGPLLIVWSSSVAYFSIRDDILPVLFSLYFAFNLIFGWMAFFLMLLHFPNGRIYPPDLHAAAIQYLDYLSDYCDHEPSSGTDPRLE
jgi:hypothetical protein